MDRLLAQNLLFQYNNKQLNLSPDQVTYLQQIIGNNTLTSQPQNQSLPSAPQSGSMEPEEEQRFNEWYAGHANKYKLNPNVDDPQQHYDTRGFYKSMMSGQDESPELHHGHMSSAFKDDENMRDHLVDSKGKIYNTISGKYLDGSPVSEKELQLGEMAPTIKGK